MPSLCKVYLLHGYYLLCKCGFTFVTFLPLGIARKRLPANAHDSYSLIYVLGGHEATETGLAYAPVSQAHGHNHIVQCFSCCTAAQTSSVPHHVVADCALALVLWTLRSARTHHPPTVPVSL